MDAAGGDVRGHEYGDVPGLELGQGPGALGLRLPSVQSRRPHPAGQQVVGELVHGALGVQEHDDPAFARGDLGRRAVLVGAVDVQHMVLHRRDCSGGRVYGVDDRVTEVTADQAVDVAVQGGGKEHPLPFGADLVEEFGDLGHEAHVGHLVSLVQDADRDLVEPAVTAVDEILESSRRRHDDFGTAAQRVDLPPDRHSAHDRGQPQPDRTRVRSQCVGHLLGQLTRRYQDQRQRLSRLSPLTGSTGQQGEAEGQGLTGPGAPPAQGITARESVGQGRPLDRERNAHPLHGQRRQQLLGHVEVGERLGSRQCGSDRDRQGKLALDRDGPPSQATRATRTSGASRSDRTGRSGRVDAAAATNGVGGSATCAGRAVVRTRGVHSEPSLRRLASRNSSSERTARGITRTGRAERGIKYGMRLIPHGEAGHEASDTADRESLPPPSGHPETGQETRKQRCCTGASVRRERYSRPSAPSGWARCRR